MWKTHEYRRVGKRNEERGIMCQDQVCYAEKDAVQVITLADGAGEDQYAGIGAEKSCQVLATLLANYYEELYAMEETHVRFHIAANVKSELFGLCDQYGVGIDRLRSTLLGIAIDHKSNTFMAVHLGDGQIEICRRGESKTISHPENGRNRRQTYLTSMRKMGRHLRILRGDVRDIRGFSLRSDGWRETADKKNEEIFFTDDVSCISLLEEGQMQVSTDS